MSVCNQTGVPLLQLALRKYISSGSSMLLDSCCSFAAGSVGSILSIGSIGGVLSIGCIGGAGSIAALIGVCSFGGFLSVCQRSAPWGLGRLVRRRGHQE